MLRRQFGSSGTDYSRRSTPSRRHSPASSSVQTTLRGDLLQRRPATSIDTAASTAGVAREIDIAKSPCPQALPAQEYSRRLDGRLPEPLPAVVPVRTVRGVPAPTRRPISEPFCRRRRQQAKDRGKMKTSNATLARRTCPRTGPSPADGAESNNNGPGRPRRWSGHRPSAATVRDRYGSSTVASRGSDAGNET